MTRKEEQNLLVARLVVSLNLMPQATAAQVLQACATRGQSFELLCRTHGLLTQEQLNLVFQHINSGSSPDDTTKKPGWSNSAANSDSEHTVRYSSDTDVTSESDSTGSAPRLPKIGEVIDGYHVISLIGQGGMGAVYKVQKGEFIGALKCILSGVDFDALSRFEREGQAVAAVDRHPGIVKVHTYGEFRSAPYLVFDFVDGSGLDKILAQKQEAWSIDEISPLLTQLADAIDFVHSAGILHRDLKPANVLFNSQLNRYVVTDFGLARVQSGETLTKTGEVMGTPSYMAPEQVEGRRATTATDVWALAVMAYELLTGEKPFKAPTTIQLCAAIVSKAAKPVTELRGELSSEFDKVFEKAFEKDQALRYQTCAQFLHDFETASRGESITDLDPIWLRRVRRFRRQYRLLVNAMIVGLIVCLLSLSYIVLRPPPAYLQRRAVIDAKLQLKFVRRLSRISTERKTRDSEAVIKLQFEAYRFNDIDSTEKKQVILDGIIKTLYARANVREAVKKYLADDNNDTVATDLHNVVFGLEAFIDLTKLNRSLSKRALNKQIQVIQNCVKTLIQHGFRQVAQFVSVVTEVQAQRQVSNELNCQSLLSPELVSELGHYFSGRQDPLYQYCNTRLTKLGADPFNSSEIGDWIKLLKNTRLIVKVLDEDGLGVIFGHFTQAPNFIEFIQFTEFLVAKTLASTYKLKDDGPQVLNKDEFKSWLKIFRVNPSSFEKLIWLRDNYNSTDLETLVKLHRELKHCRVKLILPNDCDVLRFSETTILSRGDKIDILEAMVSYGIFFSFTISDQLSDKDIGSEDNFFLQLNTRIRSFLRRNAPASNQDIYRPQKDPFLDYRLNIFHFLNGQLNSIPIPSLSVLSKPGENRIIRSVRKRVQSELRTGLRLLKSSMRSNEFVIARKVLPPRMIARAHERSSKVVWQILSVQSYLMCLEDSNVRTIGEAKQSQRVALKQLLQWKGVLPALTHAQAALRQDAPLSRKMLVEIMHFVPDSIAARAFITVFQTRNDAQVDIRGALFSEFRRLFPESELNFAPTDTIRLATMARLVFYKHAINDLVQRTTDNRRSDPANPYDPILPADFIGIARHQMGRACDFFLLLEDAKAAWTHLDSSRFAGVVAVSSKVRFYHACFGHILDHKELDSVVRALFKSGLPDKSYDLKNKAPNDVRLANQRKTQRRRLAKATRLFLSHKKFNSILSLVEASQELFGPTIFSILTHAGIRDAYFRALVAQNKRSRINELNALTKPADLSEADWRKVKRSLVKMTPK